MDSTAMQVITPLVAAGVSAYSPRYGGAGVQGGLAALRTMQERNYENQRIKLAQDRENQSLLAQQDQQKRFGDLLNGMRPNRSVGGASGNVPEATEALRSQAADTGQTPQPAGFQPSDQELQLAAALGPVHGPQFLAQRFGSYQKEEQPSYQKANHRVFGGYGSDIYVNPKTLESREIATGPEDEKQTPENADLQAILGTLKAKNPNATILDAIKARAQANQGPVNSQLMFGSDNKPYAFDPRTNRMIPVEVPGAPGPAGDFSDVQGGSSSTAREMGGGTPQKANAGPLTFSKSGSSNLFNQGDADVMADRVVSGQQPPILKGLYRNAAAVQAAIARRYPDFNLAQAQLDYEGTQKRMSTLNGQQQVRLQQAVQFAHDSLDNIEQRYNQLRAKLPDMGFQVFNRAALSAAKQLPGEVGANARTLDAAISDLTAEMGNVYMGGNSPTDHGLALASKNLSADWNEEQFKAALALARQNLKYRLNSMQAAGAPAGVSANSPYGATKTGGAPTPEPPATAPAASQSGGIVSGSGKYRWNGSAWVPNQ